MNDPMIDSGKVNAVLDMLKGHKGQRNLSISGRSMRPLIEDTDRITFTQIIQDRIRTGDIIVFREKNKIIVHRVIWKKRKENTIYFCQKGDSSPICSWIKSEDILGKVTVIHKKNKVVFVDSFISGLLNRILGFLGAIWVFYSTSRLKPEAGNPLLIKQMVNFAAKLYPKNIYGK